MGYMAYKLLMAYFNETKADDRDSYANKRIDLTGASLNNLFRNYLNKLVKDMEKQVIREINTGSWRSTDDYENIINQTNIYKLIKSSTIENGFKRALSTGDFGIKHTNSNKVGVAQVLNRLTYVSSLSHLRRISTPADKSGKLIPPRKLHTTTWGFMCPAETPEGQSVGIVKNLSYMSHVTISSNSISLYEYILPHVTRFSAVNSPADLFGKVKVFINGAWVGISLSPVELYTSLKDKKSKGIINIYMVTNGTLLTPKRRESLMQSGLTKLFVSLDAVTAETYNKQRLSGQFNKVVANVLAFIKERNELGQQFPLVRVSFLKNQINIHEEAEFTQFWTGKADLIAFQKMNEVPDKDTGLTIADVDMPTKGCDFPFKQLVIDDDGLGGDVFGDGGG